MGVAGEATHLGRQATDRLGDGRVVVAPVRDHVVGLGDQLTGTDLLQLGRHPAGVLGTARVGDHPGVGAVAPLRRAHRSHVHQLGLAVGVRELADVRELRQVGLLEQGELGEDLEVDVGEVLRHGDTVTAGHPRLGTAGRGRIAGTLPHGRARRPP
ncbi:hypothetical protein [Nocardioides daphniae]|uniref:Uncharacterized protein n=1 Tax=Nocardioides daphniae TaxID=402297 RepID=A0A4P7UDI4_9ACTN|nr:hypothetical protein [Nocardioides daphniae]QCC78310.1 hypothetical protein E2C04_15940 [Nocardioides daphniae]GGD13661.1 hypothetical protein GCM10007231_10920 [Nocardioides daphniae]